MLTYAEAYLCCANLYASAYVSIRQHTSARAYLCAYTQTHHLRTNPHTLTQTPRAQAFRMEYINMLKVHVECGYGITNTDAVELKDEKMRQIH